MKGCDESVLSLIENAPAIVPGLSFLWKYNSPVSHSIAEAGGAMAIVVVDGIKIDTRSGRGFRHSA
jgi:hypothetical protein